MHNRRIRINISRVSILSYSFFAKGKNGGKNMGGHKNLAMIIIDQNKTMSRNYGETPAFAGVILFGLLIVYP
jgi:hypothetical protein